jgi:hypothetical protein
MVTYGMAMAYLAARYLQLLAYDEKEAFPAAVVYQDLFVVGLISGAQSQEEALELSKT